MVKTSSLSFAAAKFFLAARKICQLTRKRFWRYLCSDVLDVIDQGILLAPFVLSVELSSPI